MGVTASLYWQYRAGAGPAPGSDPGFESDSKAFARWIVTMQDRRDELVLLEELKLGVLTRSFWTEGIADAKVAWASPAELEAAASTANRLLLDRDARFERILRVYAEHGYGGSRIGEESASYASAARSSLEWRADIRRMLRRNPFLVAPSLPSAELDPERPDFSVTAGDGEGRFTVTEDESRFGRLSIVQDGMVEEDAMVAIFRDWLPPGRRLKKDKLYYRAEAKLLEAEDYVEEAHSHQRAALALAEAVVAVQQAFFAKGPDWLVPANLAELATASRLNEGLVRSLIKGKTLQSPQGLFPLEHFVVAPRGRAVPAKHAFSLRGLFQQAARGLKSWRAARALEVDRRALARDLLDLATLARWAAQNELEKVAIGIRF